MRKNKIFLAIITVLAIVIAIYSYAWGACYKDIGFRPEYSLTLGVVTGSLEQDSYNYKGAAFQSKGQAVANCLKDRFHL